MKEACTTGDINRVKYLHEHGADITAENNYAVQIASAYEHLELVRYLHKHGADITCAVRWAAAFGHLEVVKYLHEHGADITNVSNHAVRWAAKIAI